MTLHFEPQIVAAIARLCLGEPNAALCKKDELRFGHHGSIAVRLDQATFFDHEAEAGGGMLDLVERAKGHKGRAAIKWLAEHGLDIADEPAPRKAIVATFDYVDELGELLFQVVRYQPKDFRQRRPDPSRNGEWIWDLKGVPAVPYRLPELIDDVAMGRRILIVEGERKADLLRSWGSPATCNAGGAKKWGAEHSKHLRGADAVMLADNDPAGRAHRDKVAASLLDFGASVRVLILPGLPPKGDIIDWAKAGGTREQLDYLIEHEARPWAPSNGHGETPYEAREPFIREGHPREEQKPRKITPTSYVWRDPTTLPRRQWLYGNHYARKFVSATLAPGGLGKSSKALVEAVAMVTGLPLLGVAIPASLRVWYWNGEDPQEEIERRIGAILLHFKIDADAIGGRLFIDNGRETPICIARRDKENVIFTPDAMELLAGVAERSIDVFTLDPFVKTHGVRENDNGAIDAVARQSAAIADEANCAIELLHHVRKASTAGRAEVTVDDGRGAGSLNDAARAVRVLNVMTAEEAVAAQVKPEERKRYFRADSGKANMAPRPSRPHGSNSFQSISTTDRSQV